MDQTLITQTTPMTKEQIWRALDDVMDPEIPTVSLIDMGIVRAITLADNAATVIMTPTFSGCPALTVMESLIVEKLTALGVESVQVQKQFNPPWTSDWITAEGRRKLKEFGLMPPRQHGGNIQIVLYDSPSCPYCDSANTSIKNDFGTTLCRSMHYCNACQQPIEQFKAL